MRVHLVNPSALAFGVGVITPRWLYVLAAATPGEYGDPIVTDETLERWDSSAVSAGDVVGIGIHTGNAVQGYEIGKKARACGAYVVFGGIQTNITNANFGRVSSQANSPRIGQIKVRLEF